jgi:hypothetical protein
MQTVAAREVGLEECQIDIGHWIMFNTTGVLAKLSRLMDQFALKGSNRD